MNTEELTTDIFEDGREVEAKEEEAEQKDDSFDLTPYYFNLDVISLNRRLSEENSILIPSFQRNFVWDKTGASLFIDSMLRGLPSPSLFFFEEERQRYLVIDGQQRILSLYYFIKGVFPDKKKHQSVKVSTTSKNIDLDHVQNMFTKDQKIEGEPFTLIGKVNDKWRGKTFQELEPAQQNFLLNTQIYIVNLRQTSPTQDNSSMFLIFERINTGAKHLNAQQIRLCVGHGEFANAIDGYTEHPIWNKFKLSDNEGNISELILRFLALYYTDKPFTSSMRRFLDNFLNDNKNFKQNIKKDDLENLIPKSLDIIKAMFDVKDFSPVGKFNGYMFLPVWLGIAASLDKINNQNQQNLKSAFNTLKKEAEFKSFYTDTRRAASAKNLYPIISLAKKIFTDI